jgi:predicted CoA-binding protein
MRGELHLVLIVHLALAGLSSAFSLCPLPRVAKLEGRLPSQSLGAARATPSRMSMDEVIQVWSNAKTVAVVGATTKETMPVYGVMKYLLNEGYKCIPVNPRIAQSGGNILGQEAVASLTDIKERVDIVDIFMRSDRIAPVVDEAIAIRAGCVWTQIGVSGERIVMCYDEPLLVRV